MRADFRKKPGHDTKGDGNAFAASFFLEKRKSVPATALEVPLTGSAG